MRRAWAPRWRPRNATSTPGAVATEGTYEDPATEGPIGRDALAAYVATLAASLPDLAFEVVEAHELPGGRVMARWVMRGTHAGGPFQGVPATGARVALPGVDLVETRGGLVTRVVGYFDVATLSRQLGLQVRTLPPPIGSFVFGTATRLAGSDGRAPGAVTLTAIRARHGDDWTRIRSDTQAILRELARADGFLSACTMEVGDVGLTVSAWRDGESASRTMARGAHKQAMAAFFGADHTGGGTVSTWAPVAHSAFARCAACGRMARLEGEHAACSCGAPLEAPRPFW
ncbi:MAG TPA: ester cyclase [Candidatus Thermoplasmatota archaeon]|nr:ester cyclase [Candidatus Thermoplasmatota archaeon]